MSSCLHKTKMFITMTFSYR